MPPAPVPWILIAIGVLIVGAAVVLLIRSARRVRGRPPAHALVAADLGLAYEKKGAKRLHERFLPLPGVPKSGDVRHVMTGGLDGKALTAFEHRYVVSTGNAVIPVLHTAYVLEAPSWPAMAIRRRSAFGRLLRRLGRRDPLELERDDFNHRFRVKCDDEAFALTLLTPEMQVFLLEKPGAAWQINPGAIALVYSGGMRADRVAASLERLRRFRSLIAVELDAWLPPPSPGPPA